MVSRYQSGLLYHDSYYGNQGLPHSQPQYTKQGASFLGGTDSLYYGNQQAIDQPSTHYTNQGAALPQRAQQPLYRDQQVMVSHHREVTQQSPYNGQQEPIFPQQQQAPHNGQQGIASWHREQPHQQVMPPQHREATRQPPSNGGPPQYGNTGTEYGNQLVTKQPGNYRGSTQTHQYSAQQGLQAHQREMLQNQPVQHGNQPNISPHPVPRPRKNLLRSISSTNIDKTAHCQKVVKQDWVIQAPLGGTNFFTTLPAFTLTLPNLDGYPPDFQQFVFNRLIDKVTQQSLEHEKCLNWCQTATRLVPLLTAADGNCLMHAASLSMWGFQDREFTLRRAVYTALQNHSCSQLHRRWKHIREMELHQMGIELEEHQWQQEWELVANQASLESAQGQLQSLEDFHIFVLASVLRRPILMYAGPKIRSQATGGTLQNINFHGIYLPLLWDPKACKKDPLPLAYYGGHFVALVAIEYPSEYSQGSFTLPLTDFHGQMLPVRFPLSMEDPTALIMDYLNVTHISTQGTPFIATPNVVAARLSIANRPAYLEPLLSGFIDACREAHFGSQSQQGRSHPPPFNAHPQQSNVAPPPAQPIYGNNAPHPTGEQPGAKCINSCGMFGDSDKGGMCSQCYQKYQEQHPTRRAAEEDQSFPRSSFGFVPRQLDKDRPKCINHCGMFGDPGKSGMCHQCHEKYLRNEQQSLYSQHGQLQPGAQLNGLSGGPKCINDCGSFADPNNTIGMCSRCFARESQAAVANEGITPPQQQQQHGQPQPNYSNGGGSSLSMGSIKCPKCSNPGHPNYLGMCEACYQGGSLAHEPLPPRDDHIYETIPSMSNAAMPQDTSVRKQCKTPGCDFFGTAETAFYCSKCFERDMDRILKEADGQTTAGQPRAQPSKLVQFEQRVENIQPEFPASNTRQDPAMCSQCNKFFANAEYRGMCSSCFMEKTKAEAREPAPKQQELFVQAPMYKEPCRTVGCSNHAQLGGLCNLCLQEQQQPLQKTAPVYQPQFEKCANMDCNGLRTQNGFCDNCNMQSSRIHAATQQHPTSVYTQSRRPIPKPRQPKASSGHGGISTAPIMHLSSAMDGMSITGGNDRVQCFMCTGLVGSSNVLCRKHAELTKTMMDSESPGFDGDAVKSKPQAQRSYHQQPRDNFGMQQEQSTPSPLSGGMYRKTGPNQGIYLPQGPSNHYDNPQPQQGLRQAPQQAGSFVTNGQGEFGTNLSAHGNPQNNIINGFHGNSTHGNYPGQQRPDQVPFGVNMELPTRRGAAAGGTQYEKLLCATAGCSFKGYHQLRNLCPDCYETATGNKSPDDFPLV